MDLHSYNSDSVMIQDYAQKTTTIITPANSTDPNGSCTVSHCCIARDLTCMGNLIGQQRAAGKATPADRSSQAPCRDRVEPQHRNFLPCKPTAFRISSCMSTRMRCGAQSRSFIPSMEKFADGSNGAQYPTANFLLFADSTSMPRFRAGRDTARGIPCEVRTAPRHPRLVATALDCSFHLHRTRSCCDANLDTQSSHMQNSCLAAVTERRRRLVLQVWYRRIADSAANSSLDVDFYFPVDQWVVAREDYHRSASGSKRTSIEFTAICNVHLGRHPLVAALICFSMLVELDHSLRPLTL